MIYLRIQFQFVARITVSRISACFFTISLLRNYFRKFCARLTSFTGGASNIVHYFLYIPILPISLLFFFLFLNVKHCLFSQLIGWMLVWWFVILSFLEHDRKTEISFASKNERIVHFIIERISLSCISFMLEIRNINAIIWINNRIGFVYAFNICVRWFCMQDWVWLPSRALSYCFFFGPFYSALRT